MTASFAVAFGGGGARGLAHIHVIEALDELGIKPVMIAGSSIGAIIGAGMASGMTGRDIRNFAWQDDYTVNLNIDRREVYQLKTIINCPDLGGAGLSYRSSADVVCDGLDLNLVARTTRGPRECAVKSIRKLSPAEVAALPTRARP